MPGRSAQFAGIVFDVLQNIDIYDCIEPAGRIALALTGGLGVKEFLRAEMSS